MDVPSGQVKVYDFCLEIYQIEAYFYRERQNIIVLNSYPSILDYIQPSRKISCVVALVPAINGTYGMS